MRASLSRSLIVSLAACVILTLIVLWRLAFTDLILARGDTYTYFTPLWSARDAALRAGDLPLWTPDVFMGAPLLANSQIGALYPPNWLTIGVDTPQAIKTSIVIHTVWAMLGAAALARAALRLDLFPALIAGAVYAFGGHVGGHVEQINQLQGLSWLPWLFAAADHAFRAQGRSRWGGVLLGAVCWAMMLLAGHTQIAFISGVGLGIYALLAGDAPLTRRDMLAPIAGRLGIVLACALIAVLLALPQMIPAQELASLSNRGGGLNQRQAMAFSWNPLVAARGLLPSYDGQLFAEYLAWPGLIALLLALIGATAAFRAHRAWIALLIAGLILALGSYTPLYWPLATLPGFNLFRVPARWLALFALAAAMMAGYGAALIISARVQRRSILVAGGVIGALMFASLLAAREPTLIDGPAAPTVRTWFGWVTALLAVTALLGGITRRERSRVAAPILFAAVAAELFLASQNLPYNDATDPAIAEAPRFTVRQLQVYADDPTLEGSPPGRVLSISEVGFDPGDRADLEARWSRIGLGPQATAYAFTAIKLQDVIAPNLPMLYGLPSIDGFDGGLLPTLHYTAFSSLLLPEGSLRTIDGRLREWLALEACRGACIPPDRWLDLTHTRYLLVDKVYDLNHDGIFYDTALTWTIPADGMIALSATDLAAFEADALHVLVDPAGCEPACVPRVTIMDADGTSAAEPAPDDPIDLDGLRLYRFARRDPAPNDFSSPSMIILSAGDDPIRVRAMTRVDTRTGDFVPLTPPDWRRVYSSEIKIFENLDVLPRALVTHEALLFPDTWDGTESALDAMRAPGFDPAAQVTINAASIPFTRADAPASASSAEVIEYTPTRIVIEVDAGAPGYLLLTDAYYPGWEASVTRGGEIIEAAIVRADVMFWAVAVEAGAQTVVFAYRPAWWPGAFLAGGAAWALIAVLFLAPWLGRRR